MRLGADIMPESPEIGDRNRGSGLRMDRSIPPRHRAITTNDSQHAVCATTYQFSALY